MKPRRACGEQLVKRLPGALGGDGGPDLLLACQRPAGHQGSHFALWLDGVIEWEIAGSREIQDRADFSETGTEDRE